MQVDARDMFSPRPTVLALEALVKLKRHETLAVLVNDGKAVDELMHLAEEHDCGFMLENEGDYSVVTLAPHKKVTVKNSLEEALSLMGVTPAKAPVYLFGSDALGTGNDDLGRVLANEILFDLGLQEILPQAIVLYNSGAKLAQKDAVAFESLKELEELGVQILVDAVSVDALELEGKIGCGEIVDPYITVALLSAQHGVITL